MGRDGQALASLAAAEWFGLVDVQQGPRQPAIDHLVRELQMTALERFTAAYAIAGLSHRISELHELDRADEESATP